MLIIWQRFGFLVIASAATGLFGGKYILATLFATQTIPDGAFFGAIGLVAFLVNYILFHLLFGQDERYLQDMETGQQVAMYNTDSLFFIPARFFTWLFLLIAIGGGAHYGLEKAGLVDASEGVSTAQGLVDSTLSGTDDQALVPMRFWTDATTGKRVEGEILALENAQCSVRGKNGKLFTVPVSRFIAADQELIRKAAE